MRGCVSAGMIAAVVNLGVMDTFDAVYGSSAGSLVGAYAIAGQVGNFVVGLCMEKRTAWARGWRGIVVLWLRSRSSRQANGPCR